MHSLAIFCPSSIPQGLVKLEGPWQNFDLCGGAESTAKAGRWRSNKLVYCLYYAMDYNVGEWLCMIWRTFHTSCLRKILCIFWPRKISNNEFFKLTEHEDMGIVFVRWRWCCIDHVLHRDITNISKVALRIGHQRVKGREAILNPPGGGLHSQNFRP